MKPSDMRALALADFDQEIQNRKRELMELRFQAAMGQLAQPHRVQQLRREVAQLNTIRTQRTSQPVSEQEGQQ